MKILAHLVIGLGLVGTSQAQTSPARVELLPIPNTLPGILFDPAPLSGTMLKPLAVAEPDPAQPQVDPAPDAPVTAVATNPAPVTAEPAAERATAATTPVETVATAPAVEESEPEPAAPQAAEPEPAEPEAAEPKPEPKPKKPAAAATTTVTVIVEGVESAKGIINVALCDKGLSREGCPYTKATPAAAGFVEARFEDVPPGTYAVVGYHDVNSNDEFDKMLGVPREPYALSSKAGEMLAPGFKDAALKINKGDNTVIIRMQRLGG